MDSVVGIQRVSWAEIIQPNANFYNGARSIATGIIKYDDRLSYRA